MARFLFVVPPLTGHVNPTIGVGCELARRGHDVAWAGHPHVVGGLLPSGADLWPVGEEITDELIGDISARSRGLRGPAALKFLWEDFLVPLADAMVPALESVVDRFEPDVMIVDQQTVGGAVVARGRGVRWATSATTSAEFVDPLAALPRIDEWVRGLLDDLATRHGLAVGPGAGDLRFSDDLVIGFTSEALVGPIEQFPAHYVLVGPALADRPTTVAFPWSWLDESRASVLVSLGTINAEVGRRFYATVLDALGDRPYQVVLAAPDDQLSGPVPGNVLVRPYVPQLALLERVSAVVSHGGHNTVCEALSRGLPLVLAPIRDDQPIVAQQVVDAGAGLRVKFGRVRPPELRDAVEAVLDRPGFRRCARAVRDTFTAAGGSVTAADHLEKLT